MLNTSGIWSISRFCLRPLSPSSPSTGSLTFIIWIRGGSPMCHLARFSSALRLQRVSRLPPPSEVISHGEKYGRWFHISVALQSKATAKAACKEHDLIGKGPARELMPCHKKVLNAPPEGYFGTGPLCCLVEYHTTVTVFDYSCSYRSLHIAL